MAVVALTPHMPSKGLCSTMPAVTGELMSGEKQLVMAHEAACATRSCDGKGQQTMAEQREETIAERLRRPVQLLKGVGPRIAPLLQRLGLCTAADVLFHFPRNYQDLTQVTSAERIDGTGPVCVCVTVEDSELRELPGGQSVLVALLRDETATVRAVWFNQPFMQQKVPRGRRVTLFGQPKKKGLCWEFSHPRVVPIAQDEQPQGEMLPVYGATEGLTQAKLRQVVRDVVRSSPT